MRRFDRISVLRRSSAAITAGLALMLLPLAAKAASAATEIEGSPSDVNLRVRNAPIRDVLAALAARFKLTYRAPPDLTSELSGRYSGPLNQVLARILDGVDYVVEASDDGIKLVIFSPSDKTKASASAAPDNNRSSGNGQSPTALPASPAQPSLPAQASRAQAGATQPVTNNATSPAVPPLTSFLPMSSAALP